MKKLILAGLLVTGLFGLSVDDKQEAFTIYFKVCECHSNKLFRYIQRTGIGDVSRLKPMIEHYRMECMSQVRNEVGFEKAQRLSDNMNKYTKEMEKIYDEANNLCLAQFN